MEDSSGIITSDSGSLYTVKEPLDEIIRHFYYLSTKPGDKPFTRNLLPNYEVMLVFSFGAPINLSFNNMIPGQYVIRQTGLLGPLRKMLHFELLPGTDAVAIVFTLNGFYRLFNLPVDQLAEQDFHDGQALTNLLLDHSPTIYNWFLHGIWEELNNLTDAGSRVQLLTKKLSALINNNEPAFDVLLPCIPYFQDTTLQPLKVIAKQSNLSERTVQQRFQKYLGFSSKEMLRFIRFKNVMNEILTSESGEIDLFELIHNYGYHDQSHIIKDFNLFLGTTPAKFVKNIAGKEFCISKPGKFY
jgi:AraC-like DNA-binding protein